MKISFSAMKGNMGKRDFYVAMIKLSLVPKIFSYHDWAELPPEQRAQRILQKSRIPEITQYILDNEEGDLFSSLTASYNGEEVFRPSVESPELGILELPLDSQFVINDGQHRMAAIVEALKQNPTLANETISVVFFPFEDLDRMQQMFSDLNRTVKVTTKSLTILYDRPGILPRGRSPLAAGKTACYADFERFPWPSPLPIRGVLPSPPRPARKSSRRSPTRSRWRGRAGTRAPCWAATSS